MPRPQKSKSTESTSSRVRAGKACQRCNQKRIKCDAMFRTPCANCMRSGVSECVLRPTRRGTYIRKRHERGPCKARENLTVPDQDGEVHGDTSAADPNVAVLGSPASHLESSTDSLEHVSYADGGGYSDISWSAMFDHFVSARRGGQESMDKCSITYLGESFPLAIVLEDLNEGDRLKLHHPGPPFPAQKTPSHVQSEDLECLKCKGVFDLPNKTQLDALMAVFLDRVYPAYPLVNRQELIAQHAAGTVPLILLHSVCFMAATFCPLDLLLQAGYSSRREARLRFYTKVKALFDSGYEINKIVILQSSICMTFWGGGPNNYWNFYSWLSTAVTIAEGIGIHRSFATTNIQPQDQSLLRRIWWILVVRDTTCSTLVGRPFRIDVDQADTEMLTLEDFLHDVSADVLLDNVQCTYAQYQIQISKLCLIVRDIVMSRFAPGRPRVPPAELHQRLNVWRDCLPAILSWTDDFDANFSNMGPFTMTLMAQYYDHILLLYLGQSPLKDRGARLDEEHPDIEDITDTAAQKISSVACTMVTRSLTLLMPHEFFHAIFPAQATFYTKLRSPQKLVTQLGRSALNNCQMVLHSSYDCWDPSPWIMQLFNGLSSRLAEGTGSYSTTAPIDSTPEAGIFNALLGDEPWQSNPMLSSLFEMLLDLFLPQ
ncbi:hypothetical protein ASPVEDRAFT_417849 [Aspergillus versicolor CBS 583.65]|uniref:Zn(2)-C6 fungal-type domain-containing protein n=1 Tax=Aspergillus versicolor CBS 583.65 TaxID=1036611 RepID=A0A1L9Q4U0_ASPVE|nr:uncharacterized protein ASPVEDRAFT_417849 [Aspergillus versicolor CBS 583.65]OJJ08790.1 hypothetical protein ASPVEDRAFT_417849 [Aspergillus versicolor CBS 583.65]